MSEWVRINEIVAAPLLSQFEVSEDAESLLSPNATTRANVEALADAGFYFDAIKLLAHALPKREAVWWACLASRQAQTPDTDQHNIDALVAAEAWAHKPTEENRQRCKALGQLTKSKTPASWAATAASWCAGSIANPGEPEVAPPAYLYAHAVAGSVTLAASFINPDNPNEHMKYSLLQGANLASGGNGIIN
ncbi:hypothetical protein MAH1_33200 [Sessilibacter sp. MAH1]